jgi:hypothetical protein
MNDAPSADIDKFRTALSDVVWRFQAYDAYGRDPKKAIRALQRRAPGYPADFYQEQFELNLSLLTVTIEAVEKAPKHFKPEHKYSDFSDVDQDYVMNALRSAFPGQTDEFLKDHVGMVIYWYYLR